MTGFHVHQYTHPDWLAWFVAHPYINHSNDPWFGLKPGQFYQQHSLWHYVHKWDW